MAYASPPHSTGAASPSTKSVLDSTFRALSQAPPPTIREILGAYSTKGEGDRDMLVALLNAKSAEDQRIAAVAALQQTVLQMQHSLAVAQAQAQVTSPQIPQQLPSPRSGPSPMMAPAPAPRKRASRAPAPTAPRPSSRSSSPRYEHYSGAYRAHPYARPHDHAYVERPREADWTHRRNWASMSSERSTSEEGSERE
ncbi:hypothetical protein RSOLAG22IIIB_00953 [Rhizoctonia solani]|uniref:Uncharacterized protein n=1 Tax=Rhizoctonia solani TaxID=456999 RepID=A0A0K6G1P1_9AGAM|nr:hypothetical protein RSOLAG22IIIB_00953 [Rhizoctonia solani]